MKSLSIKKGYLASPVNLPSSKSYANRALILSAISEKSPVISNLPTATDVTNLLKCFMSIGLEFQLTNDHVQITNSFPACENKGAILEVGDGGTTARFLAAMLLLGKEAYTLKLGKRLKDRPWQEFIDLATSLGACVELNEENLILKGPISFPNEIEIDCSKTTQFATAFQLISCNRPVKISPINLKSSVSYWQMTEKIIHEMSLADTYSIPLDWSSASYPLAFGALNQRIEFPQLRLDHFQSDSKFVDILNRYQAISQSDDGSIVVVPVKKLVQLDYDVSDALDLVPALAFFLAHIPGTHKLLGINNLKHKESDRLKEVMRILRLFGRSTSTDGDSLIIEGNVINIEQPISLSVPDDHRMVMMGTLFLLQHSGGSINHFQAVEKSYPGFFGLITSSEI